MDAPTTQKPTRLAIGCMTGTSLDGLDAGLVRIHGHGLSMRADFLDLVSLDFPPSLRDALLMLASGRPLTAGFIVRSARWLGDLHAQAVAQLMEKHGEKPDFVCAHGQTVWHDPGAGAGVSWQLFDPWPVVRRCAVPVVYDLRQADLAAGGQGAPITPITDPILYRRDQGLVFNLGGICNVTLWQGSLISGGDIGPCNLVLDALVRALVPGQSFDEDGRIALSGKADPQAVADALRLIDKAKAGIRSLGREQYGSAFVHGLRHGPLAGLSVPDAMASAVEAVAMVLGEYAGRHAGLPVILAGGGARNPALVAAFTRHAGAGARVQTSDCAGVPAQAREAMAFAVLGALSQDGVPITLPEITGAVSPGVAGVWAYPGRPAAI